MDRLVGEFTKGVVEQRTYVDWPQFRDVPAWLVWWRYADNTWSDATT